jgi:excisionase family DNA binding protein
VAEHDAAGQTMTVREVAEALRLHPDTIRDWLRAGRIRGVRLGGPRAGWRIPRSEVDRLLREGEG